MNLVISLGTVDEMVTLSRAIPEFESPYDAAEYHKRLKGVFSLVLIARINQHPVGFKAGYALNHAVFYSWMGGVVEGARKKGVAKALAAFQQKTLKEKGYTTVRTKTRAKHQAMLNFLLEDGFVVVKEMKKEKPEEKRIILEKQV